MENKKKNLIITAIAVVTLIIVVVGATYAFFTAQGGGSSNTAVDVQTNTTDNLSFNVGEAININATQDNFGESMGNQAGSTTASATLTANNATNSATRNYYLYLNITNNEFVYTVDENTPELILTITDPEGAPVESILGLEYVTVGEADNQVSGFDITTASDVITLASNYEITSTGTQTQTWNITVTFVNLDTDQVGNAGKNFNASLIIQEDPLTTSVNLASYITDILYTEDGANGLYYHDGTGTYTNADQEAGDNSYRYSGANPNNYVCFGLNGLPCSVENLYRIVGVFDGQVKLIKSTSIGNYAWDTDSNTWDEGTKPDIYTTLNETYYNTLGNEWQNLIAESTWQVGGMTFNSTITAKQYYDSEVGIGQNGYKEAMKIGLMYVSDYGYAASPENWTTTLFNYNNSMNTDNNWLYLGSNEWTISHRSDSTNIAFVVYSNGNAGNNVVYNIYDVRPVFYLNSNVEFEGGSGTESDPYRIV